jgi:hypothetical protein
MLKKSRNIQGIWWIFLNCVVNMCQLKSIIRWVEQKFSFIYSASLFCTLALPSALYNKLEYQWMIFAAVSHVQTRVFHICYDKHSITEEGERKIRVMRLHEGGKTCVNTSCFSFFERTIDRSHVGASPCFASDLLTMVCLSHSAWANRTNIL